MTEYTTLHLFNSVSGHDNKLISTYASDFLSGIQSLRGFRNAQLFRCAPHQLTDGTQPWTYASFCVRDISDPEIDVPAIAPHLANLRDAGLIAEDGAERNYTYRMYGPWKYSKNYQPGPLTHVMFLLANSVPGLEEEYHRWYENVHSVEVSEAQGYVGMRRGILDPVQAAPVHHCPGDQLIIGGMQTTPEQLPGDLRDFGARAVGKSPSGISWGPRSKAASIARTVHIFESVAGPFCL